MNFTLKQFYGIDDLKSITALLRSENGCHWDREQTHTSIRQNLIEEAYEVVEAIDCKNPDMLREELGDLLLQIIFHSQMESECNSFTFEDVVNDICLKLISRHPHVFSDVTVKDSDEALSNWNDIKQQQKGQDTLTQTLTAVPKMFPALMRAQKVQGRAKKAGFDYVDVDTAINDLKSEIAKLETAIADKDVENITEELGDLLFSATNVTRLLQNDSEQALTHSTNKFIKRFAIAESLAQEQAIVLSQADIDTIIQLWDEAKKCIQEG